MQQTAKPCVMCVCMILANFNLLSVTPQREKVTSPSIYLWVCMTCLFLKWSNTANFIRVERRGGSERWEERLICICIWSGKCKWTKWSDKRKMWIPLCSYLQIEKKRDTFFFFLLDRPFYICSKWQYQTFNKLLGFHIEIPDDVFEPFRVTISLFCLRFCLSPAAK